MTEGTSRSARFGQAVGRTLKRMLAAEHRLIDQSGSHRHWVRFGLIIAKLAVAASLALLATWTLLLVIPFLVVLFAWAHLAETGRMFIKDETTL